MRNLLILLVFLLANTTQSFSENNTSQTLHISGSAEYLVQGSGSDHLSKNIRSKQFISGKKKQIGKSLKEKNKENYNLTLEGLTQKIKKQSKFTPKK